MSSIAGGLEFLQGKPIRLPQPPDHLPARLLQLFSPHRPEVVAGQTVRRGQLVSEPHQLNQPCRISPFNGTVRQIASAPGGYQITIEPSGSEAVTTLEETPPRGKKLESWFHTLRQFGAWGQTARGVDLIEQLDAALNRPVETLVCVGLDEFPPYPDRSSLLLSFPEEAVLGTLILGDLLNARHVVILAARIPSLLSKLRSSCRRHRIRLEGINNRYPSSDPTLIARRMAGYVSGSGRLPYQHNPVEQGMVLIDPWSAIRLGRWFNRRSLDLVYPVFIASPPPDGTFSAEYAFPGQSLNDLVPDVTHPATGASGTGVILNGNPMTGVPIDPLMLIPEQQTLISFTPPPPSHPARNCINCGWCVDVCPTQLDPVRLLQACRSGHDDAWLGDQLPWCIDCGLCSHVCPSALPLAETFRSVQKQMEVME